MVQAGLIAQRPGRGTAVRAEMAVSEVQEGLVAQAAQGVSVVWVVLAHQAVVAVKEAVVEMV